MATAGLKFKHDRCQSLRRHLITDIGLADFEILTVLAAQIAAYEEDRPRAAPAAQRVFFTVVGSKTTDLRLLASSADARSAGQPIHSAFPGAQVATSEVHASSLYAARQFTGAAQ